MIILTGMLATSLMFVMRRFNKNKIALWTSCIAGAVTWLVVYAGFALVVETIQYLF